MLCCVNDQQDGDVSSAHILLQAKLKINIMWLTIRVFVSIPIVLAHLRWEETILDSRNLLGGKAYNFDAGIETPVYLKIVEVSSRGAEDDKLFFCHNVSVSACFSWKFCFICVLVFDL